MVKFDVPTRQNVRFEGVIGKVAGREYEKIWREIKTSYSRTPLNPYLSVDGSGYGLLEVMGYEGSILV